MEDNWIESNCPLIIPSTDHMVTCQQQVSGGVILIMMVMGVMIVMIQWPGLLTTSRCPPVESDIFWSQYTLHSLSEFRREEKYLANLANLRQWLVAGRHFMIHGSNMVRVVQICCKFWSYDQFIIPCVSENQRVESTSWQSCRDLSFIDTRFYWFFCSCIIYVSNLHHSWWF